MTTVLLLLDFQSGIVSRLEGGGASTIAAARSALDAARAHDIPVVFVRVAFRPGFPEVSSRNRAFAGTRNSPAAASMLEDSPATRVIDELAPRNAEPIVTKRRVGAFASDLDIVLRGLGATDLVLAGVSTSGVVLSTVRDAADRDFALTVLADAVADRDADVHRLLLEKVFPRQAAVMRAEEWIASLG